MRCSPEMPDILQDFPINATAADVFRAVSEPRLLDEWWTLTSSGQAVVGAAYELDFGPGYRCRTTIASTCDAGGV